MTLSEMVMQSVGRGLELVAVADGRNVGGDGRAGGASFSMILADFIQTFCMWLVNAPDRTAQSMVT